MSNDAIAQLIQQLSDDLLRVERDLKWAPSAVCPGLRRWFSE